MRKLLKHQFVHLVAIIAILTGFLAPTFSQARSHESVKQGFVAEICTNSGMKMTKFVDLSESSEDLNDSRNHCPYCTLNVDYVSLINTKLLSANFEGQSLYPSLFYKSPRLLTSWLILPSRAPPSLILFTC